MWSPARGLKLHVQNVTDRDRAANVRSSSRRGKHPPPIALPDLRDALSPRPDVLQFPETALTGYFVEGGVRDLARTADQVARDVDATYRAAVPDAVAAGNGHRLRRRADGR